MNFAAEAAQASGNNAVLLFAALLGIATVVALITWLKVHPFLARPRVRSAGPGSRARRDPHR